MQQAIQTALEQNPQLRAVEQMIEASTGRALQEELWPNPDLEVSSEDYPLQGSGFSSAQNMIGLSQQVPFPGKKSLDAKIGQRRIAAARWEYERRKLELVRDVRIAFAQALAATNKMAVAEQLSALARSLAEATRKRVDAGASTDQELLRAEIELQRAALAGSAARRESIEAEAALSSVMGLASGPVGPLDGQLSERFEVKELDAVLEDRLWRHPSIQTALIARERSNLELRRVRREPFPDVTLTVAGGQQDDESIAEFHASVPLPLFDRAQGGKKAARAEVEMAIWDVAAAQQEWVRDVREADARLRTATSEVETYRLHILPRAEEALRLTRAGIEAGKFEFIDLIDTQRTLGEAQFAYFESLLELNVSHAVLQSLLVDDFEPSPSTENLKPTKE